MAADPDFDLVWTVRASSLAVGSGQFMEVRVLSSAKSQFSPKTIGEILCFWQAIEALSPQPVPDLKPGDKETPVLGFTQDLPKRPPWLDPEFQKRRVFSNRKWLYAAYLGVYQTRALIDALEKKIGRNADVYDDRADSQSCLAAVMVDERGTPLPQTLSLSMCAWATGRILSDGLPAIRDLVHFDEQERRLRDAFAESVGNGEQGAPIDAAVLHRWTAWIAQNLNMWDVLGHKSDLRIKCRQVRADRTEEDNHSDELPLNSFFIEDLLRIASLPRESVGAGLRAFLSQAHSKRTDLRTHPEAGLSILDPQRFPSGRWPSEHALVFSQQIAVNALMERLREKGGLFSVNGPPGTGKTTLLREVVAQVVVERATVLAGFPVPDAAFGRQRTIHIGNRSIACYPLSDKISGFGIVVASSNNGAVENVSLELPKADGIAPRWRGAADYFADIASQIIDAPAWALLSAKLGARSNCHSFAQTLWFKSPDDQGKPATLRSWLGDIQGGRRSPSSWSKAVEVFRMAVQREQTIRDHLARIAVLPQKHNQAMQQVVAAEENIEGLRKTLLNERQCLGEAEIDRKMKRDVLNEAIASVTEWTNLKPGLWESLSTLGRVTRDWRRSIESRILYREQVKKTCRQAEVAVSGLWDKIANLEAGLERSGRELGAARKEVSKIESLVGQWQTHLGQYWPDAGPAEVVREQSSYWATPEWMEARADVFLAALAVHRSFIENAATKMSTNIRLAIDAITGRLPVGDAAAWRAALDSLTLVTPVISTTFASFPRLFAGLGAESIGWLLIDEAGQAVPQAAVGAIWRAKRTIVVGDPLQLEPITSVPATVEGALAEHFDVPSWWWPSHCSAQMLADNATPLGALLKSADGDKLWVGAPLRVHRRCDEPMFGISNAIAYNGMMVHGKNPTACDLPSSGWFDVHCVGTAGDGHWIEDEGTAIRKVLMMLLTYGVPNEEIILISPFRDVVKHLRGIGREFNLDTKNRVGTIHTSQGKEAQVVILALGGHPSKPGAKAWAAQKPNLLNVAVSRAKERFYVIGDRAEWIKHRYFDEAGRRLPQICVESLAVQGGDG
ncbi:MAG: DEAD/DEAH box helicase [Acidiferrobacterales bacterium]